MLEHIHVERFTYTVCGIIQGYLRSTLTGMCM